MIDKKGLSYVDWIISFGTFVIAIVAIFAYLKPGLQPEISEKPLLGILEKNIFEHYSWKVKHIPIFIKKLQKLYLGNPVSIEIKFNSSEFEIIYFDSQLAAVKSGNKLIIECTSAAGICPPSPSSPPQVVEITVYNSSTSSDFFIESSISCNPSNSSLCNFRIGSTEDIDGLNKNKTLSDLSSDYNSLKSKFGFPPENDFAVYIDGNKTTYGPDPPEQVQVYVKEIKAIFLDKFGKREQKILNLRVW